MTTKKTATSRPLKTSTMVTALSTDLLGHFNCLIVSTMNDDPADTFLCQQTAWPRTLQV